MKYDIYAKGMWTLLKGGFTKELSCFLSIADAKAIMVKGKQEYRKIIERTDGIGGMKKNPMTMNLMNGAMLIAIYKASTGRITTDQMGQIYKKAMSGNFFVKNFSKKDCFNAEWQKKRNESALKSQKRTFSNDWVSEFRPGKNVNEYGINFYECGICKLCKQENCFELASQMCKYDYVMAAAMGAELTRTKTIAGGDQLCDFFYKKK
jgi:hypothetical protein